MTTARVIGVFVAIAMTVGTAWMSRVPVVFGDADQALIRMSWRVDGVTVEACRTLTEEELANLPIHMRNPEACIGQIAPFVLHAEVDGEVLAHDTISPGGARGDRPIYVLKDVPVPAGSYRLSVRFDAIVPEGSDVGDAITSYSWDNPVELAPSTVALLTLNDTGSLILRQPDG